MAYWFRSDNSMLGGKRPRDLLACAPDRLMAAAQDEVLGVAHGQAQDCRRCPEPWQRGRLYQTPTTESARGSVPPHSTPLTGSRKMICPRP
ncbi:hypothetical protein PF66_05385 [Pseudomonas asplenii]|uniref:Antitoxin Xre/MbcA/ParS-like toxin-binding domain-containing protein n=1 Tax=Pseudomonas asplenii TaxID=53407 RepID=A0A0M9GDC3_9PSED|nr:hypothetical protein PF66_05385 [Pseudomonas fuscovaginae]KPA98334.1 hypothetical protein PF70_01544 [Pseudomonas fuscovaginae]